jgi:hypothetical protein
VLSDEECDEESSKDTFLKILQCPEDDGLNNSTRHGHYRSSEQT